MKRFAPILVLLAACGGDSTDPDPVPGDRLGGSPGDPAVAAVAAEIYEPRPEDFSTGHPDFRGALLSHRVALVEIRTEATVGEVNALLDELEAEIVGGMPGVPATAGALLAVRLPTSSHDAMTSALALIRSRDFIGAVTQDIGLYPDEVPRPNQSQPGWTFDADGILETWGLVAIRAPQLWNLNPAVRAAGQPDVITGVLDAGFHPSHEDLAPVFQYLGTPAVDSHGTHVAGTIGAGFDNQKGIDGVTPFAALALRPSGSVVGTAGAAMWGLYEMIVARPDMRAVNISLSYGRHLETPPVDTRSDTAAQGLANRQGAQVVVALTALAAAGYRLPFIVASAGNASRLFPGTPARYNSPFTSAAIAYNLAPITVVESDSLVAGALPATYVQSDFSNTGGHVSAPGSLVLSTVDQAGYALMSGTSMAAPHVTGLVSYLHALAPTVPAPTLLANPLRDLLVANLQPGDRNGRPQVDAFASALAIDNLLGNDAVLRRLLDVDDGTADGNLRVNAAGSVVTTDNRAADNGRIDMADFRRWRDWLLQTENPAGLSLDGPATHPKKDPNGDGIPGDTVAKEARYARGDFNGDGRLDRTGARRVAGVLGGQIRTDLQVLQHLFTDAEYQAADLPALIASGDIHMDAGACLGLAGVTSVRTTTSISGGGGPVITRTHGAGTATGILTLAAPATWSIKVDALSAAGAVVATVTLATTLALGEDEHLRPTCAPSSTPIITFTGVQAFGQARTYESPSCADTDNFAPATPVLSRESRVLSCTSGTPPSTATAQNSFTVSAMSGSTLTFTVLGRSTLSGAQVGDHMTQVNLRFTVANANAQFTISGSVSGSISAQSRFGLPQDVQVVVAIASATGGTLPSTLTNLRLQNGQPDQSIPLAKTGGLVPGEYILVATIDAVDTNSVGEFNVALTLGP